MKNDRFQRIGRIAGCAALLLVGRAEAAEPPSPDPGFVPQAISVPEGFVVEVAAAPPLVAHPTFATFDDRGRLFVSENAGVNLSAEELEQLLPNSVRMLEDTDGDGRFDKSVVFADKMTFPMGGAWHNGALYVASPPRIWRLEDTDGDGVADKRDAIVGTFGYTGNAASIHGCISGPDGRLYWCDGYHGHEFTDDAGRITSKREGSYLFSCLPDGSDVRIHCGGGMDNPVEVDFTEEGEMLGTVNIMYTRPRIDCLVHWQHGGTYPHREQILNEWKETGEFLGPVHRFGHVAVSGTQRYRSGAMDASWRDDFLVTFFNSGKVVRVVLEPDGASYRAVQREFLACLNRDFHPTDVAEDADGSLIIVDTGGWFYRGCPTSQFAKPEVPGALYRVRRADAAKIDDPRGELIDWPKLSNASLAAFLADSRFAVRGRAIAECANRGEPIVPVLRHAARDRDVSVRIDVVWACTRMIGGSMAPRRAAGSSSEPAPTRDATVAAAREAIREALSDPDARVRRTACRSLATYVDPEAMARLREMLQEDSAPIRREAAVALGRLRDARSVPSLLVALDRAADRTEEHAVVYALIEIGDPSATRRGLASDRPLIRRGAMLALDQMDGGDLTADEVVPLAASDHAPSQSSAARIFERRPDWTGRSAEVIEGLLANPSSIDSLTDVIRRLIARSLSDEGVATLVGRSLADPGAPASVQDLLLAAMAESQGVPAHKTWIAPIEGRLASADSRRVESALAALGGLQAESFKARLLEIGADASRPVLLRVAALEAAAGRRGDLTDASLDLLIGALGAGPNASVEAAQRIGRASLNKNQLVRLAPLLASASPSQLPELIGPYRSTTDPRIAAAFLAAMENAASLTLVAPHQFSDVILRYPQDLLPAANRLLDRVRQAEQAKLAKLDHLLPLVEHADPARGRDLFFAEKSKCATCHRVGDRGTRVGPDLTTIGSNRAAADLLESIVFPSATLVRDYEPFAFALTDGRLLTGLVARETGDTVFIQQQTGDPTPIRAADIEQRIPGSVSIMPNGLEKDLSESELADVVAFLLSLKLP